MKSFQEAVYEDPFRAWTTEELIGFATDKPLLYKPGTNWSYSHANFVILGEALSAITSKPVDQLIRERIVEPLGMRGTQSHQIAVIPEPVLHAYTSDRGIYEESTFWNPSWTTAKGAVMVTDICDLATSARAIGTGELVSQKFHEEQVGPSLVGLGGLTSKCPKTVCSKQTPAFHYQHRDLNDGRVGAAEPAVLRLRRGASLPALGGHGDRCRGDGQQASRGGY
jgi:CubicO group peptidase (beta-lactamase class C family)